MGRLVTEIAQHNGDQYLLIEQARNQGLVPPHATGFSEYWLHAKLTEARHDMIRRGDEDDWMVRYLEHAQTLSGEENQSEKLEAWTRENPRPGPSPLKAHIRAKQAEKPTMAETAA